MSFALVSVFVTADFYRKKKKKKKHPLNANSCKYQNQVF